jgi:hypothetical protein
LFSLDCTKANGTQSDNFACSGVGYVCCIGANSVEKTCSEKGGVKCLSTQDCSNGFKSASDTGLCCVEGTCQAKPEVVINECEAEGTSYSCKSSCTSGEKAETFNCPDSEQICCFKSQATRSYWWVWVLVLLVILLGLAIYFRKQLELWIFKRKNISSGPVQSNQRPPFPPTGGMPRRIIPGMQPRPMMGRMPPRPGMPQPGRPFPKDKELDATLKKLKDMSK